MGGVGGFVDNTLGLNLFGQNGYDQVAEAQTQSGNQAMGTLAEAYKDSKGYLEPWQTTGASALKQLAGGDLMSGYQASDAYKFQLGEGQNAINNAMAARGLGNSGAALKELTKYSQGLASQDAQQYYNNQFNRLNTLAGYGSNAATAGAAGAAAYGQNIADLQTGIGNAKAAAAAGKAGQQANAVSSGMSIAAMFSDARLKKNIEPVPKEDLDELRSELNAFYWEYKDVLHGDPGRYIGIMAQDLEKTRLGQEIVVEVDGNKMIDMHRVLSVFLATMAEAA